MPSAVATGDPPQSPASVRATRPGSTATRGTATPSLAASATGQEMRALHARVCPGPGNPGEARCHSWVQVDANGAPMAAALQAVS